MEANGQLLSLKVMRVSVCLRVAYPTFCNLSRLPQRPSLGTAWEPFYSSSPSLSAHSTASITSLQGKAPLPGHPKTLRDLTHITELLTLPSSKAVVTVGAPLSRPVSLPPAYVDVFPRRGFCPFVHPPPPCLSPCCCPSLLDDLGLAT